MYNNKQPLTRENRMYNSLRSNEFEFNNAIAEIIDNSIEANAKEIFVFINTLFVEKKEEVKDIVIVDNGDGMTKEQVQKCLTLGESLRDIKSEPGKKIGKFGVGLTLGGISIAKKIEVISKKNSDFYSTYLCLDEIEKGDMLFVPDVVKVEPESEYKELLSESSGTIIKLSKCDRLNINPITGEHRDCSKLQEELIIFLERVYRKFNDIGINIFVGKSKRKIDVFDPLFIKNHDFIPKEQYVKLKNTGEHVDKTTVLYIRQYPLEQIQENMLI